MKVVLAAASAAALLMVAGAASAQDAHVYGAVGLSHADFNIQPSSLNDIAVTAKVGVRMTRHLGVEGEFGGDIDGGGKTVRHYGAYLVGFVPAGDNFDLFARVGVGKYEVERTTPAQKIENTTLGLGVGGIWWWGQNGVRAEYTRLDNRDASLAQPNGDADVITVSFTRRF